MQTQVLESYIDNFTAFNECPPQLLSFIKGLKALNSEDVRMCKFTFNDKFYTALVPSKFFKGVNISTLSRQFIAKMLVKKDITVVSVYEFNEVLDQIFTRKTIPHMSTYLFLNNGYNDKCRHTVIKYYSLDNPK